MIQTLDLITAISVRFIDRKSSPFSLHQKDYILFQSFLVGTHLYCVFQSHINFVLRAGMPLALVTCMFTFQTHRARSLWHWTVTKATRWCMKPREWRLTVLPAMADPHPHWGWLAEPTGRRCTASCSPWRTVCWRGVRTVVCMSVQPAMAWGPRRSASPPVSLCNVSVRR